MCGIIGFNWNDEKNLHEALNKIKHRGPDYQGTYLETNLSLGHTRLSIIDLSEAGNQPMFYERDGRKVVIIFNGEIYNFKELKKELENKGYIFKTRTDTEVILASYLELGSNCVEKFNGMWAFCIYDINNQLLLLSRDRLGQKPLHYYFEREQFIFCSEIKGILHLDISKEIDKEALEYYFSIGFIPAPYTIYKKIRKVEPRQNLIFDMKKKTIEKYYYYTLPKYNPEKNKSALIKEGRDLLRDATRLRLIADVPIGAFLSGGLDSSVTVSEMAYFINLENLNTFSIGFKDKEFDETEYMELIKNFFGTNHHHEYFEYKDFKRLLNDIFYYFDEPMGDYSFFPTAAVSELARKFVTVSLSGDGGDEVFGGYYSPQLGIKMIKLKRIPKIFRLFIFKILQKTTHFPRFLLKIKEGLRISLLPPENYYTELRRKEYQPEVVTRWLTEKFKNCLELSNANLVEALIKLDYYYMSMSETILAKVDRASMKYALEVRSPFLDYRFIDFSSRIPVKWKVNMKQRKILMREIIKGKVPEKIVQRKKKGFTPPLQRWIIEDPIIDEIKEYNKELYHQNIITKELYHFYERIFESGAISWRNKNYLIKMFLFGRWAREWGILTNS